MDRRQRKTRQAIFSAFIDLLSEKHISKISVSDIIERADIGRATFYSHFETKDFLIKELCAELFCHIFDNEAGCQSDHKHIFECDTHDNVFVHLLQHLQKNDNNILRLLSCENNDLFIRYFKEGLKKLVSSKPYLYDYCNHSDLPKDFWTQHICSTFVEVLKWWIKNDMKNSATDTYKIFAKAICCDKV